MNNFFRFFWCCLLTSVIFFSCDSMVNNKDNNNNKNKDDDKPSTGKTDEDFVKRLKAFGFNTDSYSLDRDGFASDWEPLEGDYEIPTLSGSNPVYSDNLSSGSARSASPTNGVAGLSSSLFSKMKMTELYVCGSGTGNHYDGLFNLTANTINQVKTFTNSEYIANTVVKTRHLTLTEMHTKTLQLPALTKKTIQLLCIYVYTMLLQITFQQKQLCGQ